MVYSACRTLRTSDSSSAGSLSPPELFSDTSEDDESEASFDLPSTPPPLTRHYIRSKHDIRIKFPYLSGVNINKTILPLPTQSNEGRTGDNPPVPPKARHDSPIVQTPRKQQTKSSKGTGANAASKRSNGPISQDRFIPDREFINSPSSPFRIGKAPQDLSPEEKILRQRLPGDDPFMPARRKISSSRRRVVSNRVNSTRYGPHLVNDPAIMSVGSRHGSRAFSRQISNGAVWQVGGISAAVGQQPVSDVVRSRALASRWNAPMYNAQFIPHLAPSEDKKKHEARVALALDVDPTTRLLKQNKHWPFLACMQNPLAWKDNAWRKAGAENCRFQALTFEKACHQLRMLYNALTTPVYRDDRDVQKRQGKSSPDPSVPHLRCTLST